MRRGVLLLVAAAAAATMVGPAAHADERVLVHRDFASDGGCKPIDRLCGIVVEGRQLLE